MKKIILTPNAPAPIGPYSQAILVDKTLYVSGQIPVVPSTGEVIIGIEAETQQVMENLQAILKEAGMTFDNVVKTTILLSDIGTFSKVNEIYGKFFKNEIAPARETYQVAHLPKSVNIEISCVAVKE